MPGERFHPKVRLLSLAARSQDSFASHNCHILVPYLESACPGEKQHGIT